MRKTASESEHAIETYRSLIQLGTFAMKFVLVVNGGAVIALLAYLGNIAGAGASAPNLKCPMALFILGVILGGASTCTTYLTQLALYNEDIGDIEPRSHIKWLRASLLLVLASLISFAVGSLVAVARFS